PAPCRPGLGPRGRPRRTATGRPTPGRSSLAPAPVLLVRTDAGDATGEVRHTRCAAPAARASEARVAVLECARHTRPDGLPLRTRPHPHEFRAAWGVLPVFLLRSSVQGLSVAEAQLAQHIAEQMAITTGRS